MACGYPPLKHKSLGFVKEYGTNHMVDLCYKYYKVSRLKNNVFFGNKYIVLVYGMTYPMDYDVMVRGMNKRFGTISNLCHCSYDIL